MSYLRNEQEGYELDRIFGTWYILHPDGRQEDAGDEFREADLKFRAYVAEAKRTKAIQELSNAHEHSGNSDLDGDGA